MTLNFSLSERLKVTNKIVTPIFSRSVRKYAVYNYYISSNKTYVQELRDILACHETNRELARTTYFLCQIPRQWIMRRASWGYIWKVVLYLYDKVKLQAEVTPYQSRRPIDKGIGYISRHSSVIDATLYLFLSESYDFSTKCDPNCISSPIQRQLGWTALDFARNALCHKFFHVNFLFLRNFNLFFHWFQFKYSF